MGKSKQYFSHRSGEIITATGELWLWELRMYLHSDWQLNWMMTKARNTEFWHPLLHPIIKEHCSYYCSCYWYCYNHIQTVLDTYRKCEQMPHRPLAHQVTQPPSNHQDWGSAAPGTSCSHASTLTTVENHHWSEPRATGTTSLSSAGSKGKVLSFNLFVVRSTPLQVLG